MVVERVKTLFVCDLCKKEYIEIVEAEECKTICRRIFDSPALTKLKLSPRVFSILYRAKIDTFGTTRTTLG